MNFKKYLEIKFKLDQLKLMSKNNNNIPKKKEIDFSAIDNLLFHTKSTHLDNS